MDVATLELAIDLAAKLLQVMNMLYKDGTLTVCEELALEPMVVAQKSIRENLDRIRRSKANAPATPTT
jgi:hypothetical protein